MNRIKGICRITLQFLIMGVICGCLTPKDSGTTLKIGLIEEPRTLNIWLASDANSHKILSQIYQPLYVSDPKTLEKVPWLAESMPEYQPQDLTYTVKIRHAKWSDGTPVTSKDIVFTVWLIKTFKIPRYYSYYTFVKKVEVVDPQTVRYYLKSPKAIFLTRTLLSPIVPESQWKPIAQNALKTQKPLISLLNSNMDHPVGCGPFMIQKWQQGSFVYMIRNPYFFGKDKVIDSRRLGPYVNSLLFKVFGTADIAILSLRKGQIDMFWSNIAPGYIENLSQNPTIELFFNEKSALYFMGFNVRRPPFNDPTLRKAIATLIDKNFIVKRILQGQGTSMPSVVPPGNLFWHCNDVARHGAGCNRIQRVMQAYKQLQKAGYTWKKPPIDASGKFERAQEIRLPDGKPMPDFTILTPPADYDPARAMCGMMIQEWLRDLGMPAYAKPMPFGALLERVKAHHDFDTFVLGYGRLSLDPGYIKTFFYSKNDQPNGWNMSGYHNSDFDRIANQSDSAMDDGKRRHLIYQMQQIIIKDVPYIPLYNPGLVEAVRKDRFEGWVPMIEGIGNVWSFCQVKPKSNDP